MKVLVISDTHGDIDLLRCILKKHKNEFTTCFHLGDSEGDNEIRSLIPDLRIVRGNCDFFVNASDHLLIDLGRHKCLLTHGHLFDAKRGHDYLIRAAKETGADHVFYGHTHKALINKEDEITIANPGSLTYPKGGNPPSYIVLTVDNDGDIDLQLNFIG